MNQWDRDLPGRPPVSNLERLATSIAHYHALGARFFVAEAGSNWGPSGLGYFVAARSLWDVDETTHVPQIEADFLERSFTRAAPVMRRFYALLDPTRGALVSTHVVGEMYRLLDEALRTPIDRDVRQRLDALVLYARYVELFRAYNTASGAERQAAFERLIRHAYRMRGTMMVHVKALYRDLPKRDKQIAVPVDAAWSVPEGKNPWKSSTPFAASEILDFIKRGSAANPARGFDERRFSDDLVPAAKPLELAAPPFKMDEIGRGQRVYFVSLVGPTPRVALEVKANKVNSDDRSVEVTLLAGARGAGARAIDHADVPADGATHGVTLRANAPGVFRVIVDGDNGAQVRWVGGPVPTVDDAVTPHGGRRSAYFYVPKGTKVVGGYHTSASCRVAGPNGEVLFSAQTADDYFSVPVAAGQDGTLWSYRACLGEIDLLTVPPWAATDPRGLLLPREVVAADARPADSISSKRGNKRATVERTR